MLKVVRFWMHVLCALLLAACAARPTLDPVATFPPFPDDKRTSVASLLRTGSDTYSHSPLAQVQGTALFIRALPEQGVQWGSYHFYIANKLPLKARVEFATGTVASEAWVAVADFQRGRWELFGPYSDETVELSLGPAHRSPNDNVYLSVILHEGNQAVVTRAELHTSAQNGLPWAFITADRQVGAPGELAQLEAHAYDIYETSPYQGYIAKYEWDLDGDGLFETDKGPEATVVTTLPFPGGRKVVRLRVTDNVGDSYETVIGLSSTAKVVDSDVNSTLISSALINGKPAVLYAYFTDNGQFLKYCQAQDPQGSAWYAPLQVSDASASYSWWHSLAEVNGRPAIAFSREASGPVVFRMALDQEGMGWGPEVLIAAGSVVAGPRCLAEVDGHPAIAAQFLHGAPLSRTLHFYRAADAGGLNWNPPVEPEPLGITSRPVSLVVFNEVPALGYTTEEPVQARLILALDAAGATWDLPKVVTGASSELHQNTAVINGQLAMVVTGFPGLGQVLGHYFNSFDGRDFYLSDSFSWWGYHGNPAYYPLLTTVDGYPAFSWSIGGLLQYVARESDGWSAVQLLDRTAGGNSQVLGLQSGAALVEVVMDYDADQNLLIVDRLPQ